MSVEVNVEYTGDLVCRCLHGPSGQSIQTDAPVDNQGLSRFFSPTDLVGSALASCILTIMGIIARRDGIDICGTQALVRKEMAASPLRRIGRLEVIIGFPVDKKLSPEFRRKLENAAATCPVKQSLHPDVQLEISFRELPA